MEQLYLFEVLVDEVTFGPTFGKIPDKKEIQVVVVFPHSGFSAFNEPFKPGIKIGSGKPHLFPCQANELYKAVTQAPLEFFVKVRHGEEIGRTTIPWSTEIVSMVDSSRIITNNVTSVSSMGTYDIVDNGNDFIMGSIKICISFSSLGQMGQTLSQILDNLTVSQLLEECLKKITSLTAMQLELLARVKELVFLAAEL